jgi:hypothetical protein
LSVSSGNNDTWTTASFDNVAITPAGGLESTPGAAGASQLGFAAQPQNTLIGVVLARVIVQVVDGSDNPVSSNAQVTLTSPEAGIDQSRAKSLGETLKAGS